MITVVPIPTPTLGDRSYLAHDGTVALVVDPQRDIDRVLDIADAEGVRITHVFETHLHNDYLTGGLALARDSGALYHVNADDRVGFDRVGVRDGDVVDVGPAMPVRVIATPGHTFTHLAYALEPSGQAPVVFSGGSLLFGSTGRPDLLGPQHTKALVRHQYASARRLAAHLPDAAELLPTHGFGSFCAATQSNATDSTIGQERRTNPALTQDEEQYVRELLAGLGDYPAYYTRMAPANAAGPAPANLSAAQQAGPDELRRRLAAGEWVVDLRTRSVFAAGHTPGTFNFGLDGAFATYLGWLIPDGAPLTLLGDSADQVSRAQRELVRIGIDRPAAQAAGEPRSWSDGDPASYPRAGFADLARVRHHRPVTVLDVRRADEWRAGHIEGAVNLPLHELPQRAHEAPPGEVWVHCAVGYRASVAASILAAEGRDVVLIDDDFTHAASAGLAVSSPEPVDA